MDFPLDNVTAIHIWNKQRGCASEYERIFERKGQSGYRLFTYGSIDSYRAKSFRDIYTGHPSQKPQKLISNLINDHSEINDIIIDFFLATGTTCYCAKKLNRYSIGIEISEKYCEIAANRCRQSVMELGI